MQGALDALGLDDRHRGIVVAHADTDSPHVHVLVSRVCPETGRAVKVTKPAVRRLQHWAVDYERRTGGVVIENRVRRQQARAAFTAEVAALKTAGVPEKDAVDVTRENNPLPPQRPPPRRPREAHRDRASRVAGTERAPARPVRPAPGPGQGRAGPVGTAPPGDRRATGDGFQGYRRRDRLWRGGQVIQSWVTSALVEAELLFRRVRGYRDLRYLVGVLDALAPPAGAVADVGVDIDGFTAETGGSVIRKIQQRKG